mmetsp:Transcript_22193/g.37954  ORF Transcript_22193/g.37954 Transcript_22193/m.37954 type:complete len:454 (-) Transcript_22193:1711-3072(-)
MMQQPGLAELQSLAGAPISLGGQPGWQGNTGRLSSGTAQPRSVVEVGCPRAMVGRVIGKNGETIKALQTYTGALIQIDQSTEPTRVTISGTPSSLTLAVSMVQDICQGTFKGFALLRQLLMNQGNRLVLPGAPPTVSPPARPVYAPGYGLIPPSQQFGADGMLAGPLPVQLVGSNQGNIGQLMQPSFQYMQAAQLGGLGGSQLMMGMPGGVRPQLMGQAGPLMNQQMFSQVPLPGGSYATQMAYYPSQDYSASAGEPIVAYQQLQQQDFGAMSMGLQAMAGSLGNTGNMGNMLGHVGGIGSMGGMGGMAGTMGGMSSGMAGMGGGMGGMGGMSGMGSGMAGTMGAMSSGMGGMAGGMGSMAGSNTAKLMASTTQAMRGVPNLRSAPNTMRSPNTIPGWAEAKVDTMGQAAVNELLGTSPVGSSGPAGTGSNQLVQVLDDQGGTMRYYFQGAEN